MRAEFNVDSASAGGLGNCDYPFPRSRPPFVPQVVHACFCMAPEYCAAGDEAGGNGFGTFTAESSIAMRIRQYVFPPVSYCASENGQQRSAVNTNIKVLPERQGNGAGRATTFRSLRVASWAPVQRIAKLNCNNDVNLPRKNTPRQKKVAESATFFSVRENMTIGSCNL